MLKRWQKITLIVIAATAASLSIYDVAVAAFFGNEATISVMITWISRQWWGATIVFSLGYLFGHFFAQNQ